MLKSDKSCYMYLQGEKKVAPYDFPQHFRLGWDFLHKILYIYWQFISTYVYRFSFNVFILTFNEMVLILPRAPVIFTVSSFNVQQPVYSVKMQSTRLMEMSLLFSSPNI